MLRITYYVHATTPHNEDGIRDGSIPGPGLSALGEKQARELKEIVRGEEFDAVYCSDLKRAVDTARTAFGEKYKVIPDARLRECDYGSLNGHPKADFISGLASHVKYPFPGGESYRDVERRMGEFLREAKKKHDGRRIAIVAHQAPQLALEVLLNGRTWEQAFHEDWRNTMAYQPGWRYEWRDDRVNFPLRYAFVTPTIVLADKPVGISSFDVIRALRKELNIKKIGHAGTLDPLASGLMILGVGDGTKQLEGMIKLDKTYEGEILFGVKTASGDMEGEVLERIELTRIDEDKVKEVIASLQGEVELPLPSYSAKKVDGKKLYELARQDKAPAELPTRVMKVHTATFHELLPVPEGITARVTFDVASGTYVRSLAEEAGRRMGLPSTLYALRRTRVGPYAMDVIDRSGKEAVVTYSKVKVNRR